MLEASVACVINNTELVDARVARSKGLTAAAAVQMVFYSAIDSLFDTVTLALR